MPSSALQIPVGPIRVYAQNFNFLKSDYVLLTDFAEFEEKVSNVRQALVKLKASEGGFFINLSNDLTAFKKISDDFVDADTILDWALFFFKELDDRKIATLLFERIARPAAGFTRK